MDLEMLIDSFIEYFELYDKNEKYTIYYDETNNPIKIQYKENDTNIDLNKLNKNYLLGGVAFKEKPTNIETINTLLTINFSKNGIILAKNDINFSTKAIPTIIIHLQNLKKLAKLN